MLRGYGETPVSPTHTNAQRLYKWALRVLHLASTHGTNQHGAMSVETKMARTVDQQIAETQAKLARLKTRQKASETRRKIIVGAIVTSAALNDPKIARWMASTLRKNATREVDQKELVGLLEDLDQVAAKADQT